MGPFPEKNSRIVLVVCALNRQNPFIKVGVIYPRDENNDFLENQCTL
jgi:hypothetical protein